MTDHDHGDYGDHADRSRGDWWSALTDWLRADPASTGPHHQHRANLDRGPDANRYRGPDANRYRGPDGELIHGCLIPSGAVRITDDLHREPTDRSRYRHDQADETTARDTGGDDDGAGW